MTKITSRLSPLDDNWRIISVGWTWNPTGHHRHVSRPHDMDSNPRCTIYAKSALT